jgi:hypothetical protein
MVPVSRVIEGTMWVWVKQGLTPVWTIEANMT